MFSQDGRKKQTRNLKAKPAVSTLKTVHSNYFPVGVSTFLPVCSEKSCRFNCREFSHFHTQPMFSVALMFCQTIITSCLLFQCKTRQGSNDVQFCRRDAVHKPTAGVHGPGKPARSHWCVYSLNVLQVIITHPHHPHNPATLHLRSHFVLFCSWLPLRLVFALFRQFFSFSVNSSLHQSCSRCRSPVSSAPPSLPPLLSVQITHLHFNALPPFWMSPCLPFLSRPCLHFSIPPLSKAMDQGHEGLTAVWCASAGLRASRLPSVRRVMNGLCFDWYMANTSKLSNLSRQLSRRSARGSARWA